MIILGTVLEMTFASRAAMADDDTDQVAAYAIQKRLFPVGLELNAGAGMLPLNAFKKGFVADGGVTYHFSTTWAWEIAQGAYVFAQSDTGLESQLLNNFGVKPTQLTAPRFLGSSNLVFTPFYGKVAGLNHSVNHLEIFFPIGIALGRYEDPDGFNEGLDVGVGLRWFLSTHTSLRLEGRDYLLTPSLSNFSITQELFFALGLSVAFGGADR